MSLVLPGRSGSQTETPPYVQGSPGGLLLLLLLLPLPLPLPLPLLFFSQEGLSCSPTHWPCLENLITVTFKLDDNMGCLQVLGYHYMLYSVPPCTPVWYSV